MEEQTKKMKNAIEIKDLDFAFGDLAILKKIQCEIREGEFTGIIGPNGGGKTTFLKLIMGFLKPQKGHIEVFGTSPYKAKTRMGYVPQVSQIDHAFPINVFEFVLSGTLTSGGGWTYPKESKERVKELLEELQLSEYQKRPFGKLSGGLAQRVSIARALASNPDLLLLDEPTANIDVKAQEAILELLFGMKGNRTILLVTHDLNTIIRDVDRVLCVEHEATSFLPKEVCEHFAHGLYHSPLMNKKEP